MTEEPGGGGGGPAPPARPRTLYGRRRGRRLRAGQRDVRDTLLPRLRLTLPQQPGERIDPASLFSRPVEDLWIEVGFGGGEHLAAQAEAHPAIGFIGCEVFENGVVKLLGEIARRNLADTVRILTDDARLLLAALPDASVGRAFVLFPDPWPKQRHHKRRFVSTPTLDALARILRDGAELRLATDDVDYLRWMLERATVHPSFEWLAERPADWRKRPADWPQTRYETKAVLAGRRPAFLRLRRLPR